MRDLTVEELRIVSGGSMHPGQGLDNQDNDEEEFEMSDRTRMNITHAFAFVGGLLGLVGGFWGSAAGAVAGAEAGDAYADHIEDMANNPEPNGDYTENPLWHENSGYGIAGPS